MSIEERGYYQFIEFTLRKSAYFFLFGLIGLSLYRLPCRLILRTLLAVLCVFILGMVDEYHQFLTGGRTPSIQDVLIDTAGAIFLIVAYRFVKALRQKE